MGNICVKSKPNMDKTKKKNRIMTENVVVSSSESLIQTRTYIKEDKLKDSEKVVSDGLSSNLVFPVEKILKNEPIFNQDDNNIPLVDINKKHQNTDQEFKARTFQDLKSTQRKLRNDNGVSNYQIEDEEEKDVKNIEPRKGYKQQSINYEFEEISSDQEQKDSKVIINSQRANDKNKELISENYFKEIEQKTLTKFPKVSKIDKMVQEVVTENSLGSDIDNDRIKLGVGLKLKSLNSSKLSSNKSPVQKEKNTQIHKENIRDLQLLNRKKSPSNIQDIDQSSFLLNDTTYHKPQLMSEASLQFKEFQYSNKDADYFKSFSMAPESRFGDTKSENQINEFSVDNLMLNKPSFVESKKSQYYNEEYSDKMSLKSHGGMFMIENHLNSTEQNITEDDAQYSEGSSRQVEMHSFLKKTLN